MRHVLFAITVVCLTACAPETKHSSDHTDMTAHDQMSSGIMISDARVRPPLPGRDVATAYFKLSNSGPADQLIDVTSPISERLELHTHLNEDGVMKMRRVTAIDLPANKSVEFKPGSYHVMIFGADIPEGTDDVLLTFEFVNADPVTLVADIDDMPGTQPMQHKGH